MTFTVHPVSDAQPLVVVSRSKSDLFVGRVIVVCPPDITVTSQAHSHQIRGHVYIVDKNHLYIRKFSYDGGGSLDAYFWVDYTDTLELQTNLHEVKFGVKRLFSIVGLYYAYIIIIYYKNFEYLCFQL